MNRIEIGAEPEMIAAAMALLRHFERCSDCKWSVKSAKVIRQGDDPLHVTWYKPCERALELKRAAQRPSP